MSCLLQGSFTWLCPRRSDFIAVHLPCQLLHTCDAIACAWPAPRAFDTGLARQLSRHWASSLQGGIMQSLYGDRIHAPLGSRLCDPRPYRRLRDPIWLRQRRRRPCGR